MLQYAEEDTAPRRANVYQAHQHTQCSNPTQCTCQLHAVMHGAAKHCDTVQLLKPRQSLWNHQSCDVVQNLPGA
jgi:hypothetical protein